MSDALPRKSCYIFIRVPICHLMYGYQPLMGCACRRLNIPSPPCDQAYIATAESATGITTGALVIISFRRYKNCHPVSLIFVYIHCIHLYTI